MLTYARALFPLDEGRPMHAGRTIFSQVMDHLPLYKFRNHVRRYRGDYRLRMFSCLDQFHCLAFAQLSYRESLLAAPAKLYHMGIRGKVSRTTLADANEKRDWRIYADFARRLIETAREMYAGEAWGRCLKRTVYALDSTTIDLCLPLFSWVTFRRDRNKTGPILQPVDTVRLLTGQ